MTVNRLFNFVAVDSALVIEWIVKNPFLYI